jgi:hypothetical protein
MMAVRGPVPETFERAARKLYGKDWKALDDAVREVLATPNCQ